MLNSLRKKKKLKKETEWGEHWSTKTLPVSVGAAPQAWSECLMASAKPQIKP